MGPLAVWPLLVVAWSCADDTGAGGSGGSGASTSSDDCGECFRAVECVEMCGGEVLQSGCCACPSGTFDNIDCPSAGGAGGAGGAGVCNVPQCEMAINCVESCGGPVVSFSCCPCEGALIDEATCGGGGAGGQ